MTEFYLRTYGPLVVGIVLALVWWLIWGRRAGLRFGAVGGFTLAAGLFVLLGEAALLLMGTFFLLPLELPDALGTWLGDYRFVLPLLLGIVGVVLLVFPVQSRDAQGVAELSRRSPASFTRARWFIAPGLVLALIVLFSVLAGAASERDPMTGRYTMYFVDLGGEHGMGTGIYGWFYSVPALVLVGALVLIIIVGLFLIARPALGLDRGWDIRVRTIRTRNIIAAGTGALLLHLGLIFSSLAGTAALRAWFTTSEGTARFWTSFSALEPALTAASMLCAALGVAFWAVIALSAFPLRRIPVTVGS